MRVGTDLDVRQLINRDMRNPGLFEARETNLHCLTEEGNCIELSFPKYPGEAAYFSSRVAYLGTDGREAAFDGALLWITYSELGSLSPIGWKQIEKMRLAFGETRSLQTARAHFFRRDELLEFQAFLQPCFAFGWDAFVVSFANAELFVHISHDEYWGVVASSSKAYRKALAELADLAPRESARMHQRFCLRERTSGTVDPMTNESSKP